MQKRLERIPEAAKVGGVAAGLADYFTLDPTLVRVLFVTGFFLPHFPSLIIYGILWLALPERAYGLAYESKPYSTSFSFMNPYNPNNPGTAKNNVIGGVILIVLGVLFLLDRWFGIRFGDLWPLILIAVGVWLIFRDRMNGNQPPFGNGNNSTSTPNDPYGSSSSSVNNDPFGPTNTSQTPL